MKIVVCIKQIIHTYTRTGMNTASNYIASEDSVNRINPYDEVAMEMASQIKNTLDNVKIIAVILGPIIAETELRRCLALGADRVLHIDNAATMDPWCKSDLLAKAVKSVSPDLVLCGKESLDSQNGQVGAFLAYRLDLAFVSAITKITIKKDKQRVWVQRSGGRGIREIIECNWPAVFSVDMGDIEPHIPTFEEKKRACLLPLEQFSAEVDKMQAKVVLKSISPPLPRPKQVPSIITKEESFERIQQLFGKTRIKKKGTRLQGSPESQANGMVSFLKENGFLDFKSKHKSK